MQIGAETEGILGEVLAQESYAPLIGTVGAPANLQGAFPSGPVGLESSGTFRVLDGADGHEPGIAGCAVSP